MRFATLAGLCLILLAACQRDERHETASATNAAPAPVGFQHETGFDAQGYYRPAEPLGPGRLKLTSIAVGAPSDFEAWESGKRQEIFGPIILEFEDLTSPVEDAENGARHKVRASVRPLAYRLSPGQFAFHGKDAALGEVEFDGVFDTPALALAKAGQAEGRPVISGVLTVAGQKVAGVKLAYQSGD